MPPLVVCRWAWPLLAADDLPLLSLPAAVAHTVYALVLSLLLPSDLYRGHLHLPLQLLLAFFAAACVLEWAMVWYGSRGEAPSITPCSSCHPVGATMCMPPCMCACQRPWVGSTHHIAFFPSTDRLNLHAGTPLECHKRRRMPLLLLLHAVASLGELATTIAVTILLLTARAAVAHQRAAAAAASAPGMHLCSLTVPCASNQQGARSHFQARPQLLTLPPRAADQQQLSRGLPGITTTTNTTTISSSSRVDVGLGAPALMAASDPEHLAAAAMAAAGLGLQQTPVAVPVPLALLHVVVWSSWGLQLLNLLLVAVGLWTLPQYR